MANWTINSKTLKTTVATTDSIPIQEAGGTTKRINAGNASGNVPLSNRIKCVDLYAANAETSLRAYGGSYGGTDPLAYVVAGKASYGKCLFYIGYNASSTTAPALDDIDNWIYSVDYDPADDSIYVLARKTNNRADFSSWENKYQGGSWNGWKGKTDARGNSVFNSVATTASAANAYIGADGTTILKSTSSERYKTDIKDLPDSDTLDRLRPIVYKSNPDTVPNDDPTKEHYGFIAEEIDEVDPMLVHYIKNDAGNEIPDGVQYERIVVLLVKRIHELESRLAKAGI